MLFALETTLKPTYLDKLQSPDNGFEEEGNDQQNQDSKKEPDCSIVMAKCIGELIFIFLYVVMCVLLVITLSYQINLGKFYSVLLECALCLAFD